MSITKRRFLLYVFNSCVLILFTIALVCSLCSREALKSLFTHASYYIILLLILVWCGETALLLRSFGFSPKSLLRRRWPGMLIALLLTSIVFVTVRVQFKILADEANLVSVSRSLLDSKTSVNILDSRYYYGELRPQRTAFPKRPLVFPFLLCVLHTFTGFRYQNAFVLNYIVMFLFLCGVYLGSRKFLDIQSSIAAMLLVLAYPVVTIYSTSAGFDFMNSAFFMLVLVATYCFVVYPTAASFSFLFSSLLVSANIRYESVIFLLIIPLLLLRIMKWSYMKEKSYLLFLSPLLMLPYLWQFMITRGSYQRVEEQLFSTAAFLKHASIFLKCLTDFKFATPYATALNIVGILTYVYLLGCFVCGRTKLDRQHRFFFVVLSIVVATIIILYFSYFYGACNNCVAARRYITLSILLGLAPVIFRRFHPNLISGNSLLVLALSCFLCYHPISVKGTFLAERITLVRKTKICADFLEKLDDRNLLIITSRPVIYSAMGYGAIGFDYASRHHVPILNTFKRHLYPRVILFQEIAYRTGKPIDGYALHEAYHLPDYRLETLYEKQLQNDRFLRISELELLNQH